MSRHSDFSFFKKTFNNIYNFSEINHEKKQSPRTTQPPAHVIMCEIAACRVYDADDDVTANGAAAKAGVW